MARKASSFVTYFPWHTCPHCHRLIKMRLTGGIYRFDPVGGKSRGGRKYVKLADRVVSQAVETV